MKQTVKQTVNETIDAAVMTHNADSIDDIEFRIGPICRAFSNTEFYAEWSDFWRDINVDEQASVAAYVYKELKLALFTHEEDFITSILRLMLIEDFKEYLKQRRFLSAGSVSLKEDDGSIEGRSTRLGDHLPEIYYRSIKPK